jgi:hypothetical protein
VTDSELSLTPAQKAVAEASPDARLVVLAPAGSGKTEVLAARVRFLVSDCGLRPGDDLLVLSFSRTAVREVKRRLRLGEGRSANVKVVTFDSYATRGLALYSVDDDWEPDSYEGRIRRATKLLTTSSDFRDEVAGYRHVLIDELQDLVGVRASFVKVFLEALMSGFTLLGDPAQGIFDFQLKGSTSGFSSNELLRWVLGSLKVPPAVAELHENFRATNDAIRRVTDVGPALRGRARGEAGDDSREIRRLLENDLCRLDVVSMRTLGVVLRWYCSNPDRTAAVLCRFNGQALAISSGLHDLGVPHRLQQAADDAPVAPWVARSLAGYRFSEISRSRLAERVDAVEGDHPPPETAWRILKHLEGRTGAALHLPSLASRIRIGPIGDEIAVVPVANVVVSTVHHAKGLEWDVVVLCGLEEPWREADLDEESRILYVAMTRARDDIWRLEAPEIGNLRSREQSDRRWIQSDGRTRRLTRIEIRPDDVHSQDPAGRFLLLGDPEGLQARLAAVPEGDAVDLICIRRSVVGQPRAFYRIDHGGVPIGVTSDAFGASLFEVMGRLGRRGDGFPEKLSGAHVYAIETVAGSRASGIEAGLGDSALWLRPRLYGLADVDWGAK